MAKTKTNGTLSERVRIEFDNLNNRISKAEKQRYALLTALKLIATGTLDEQRLWCAKNVKGPVCWSSEPRQTLCSYIAAQAIAEAEKG